MLINIASIFVAVNQIQAKISYLRGYYSKELAKINKSRKSGAGSDEVYSSSWIHFKSLDTFLKTQIVPRGSQSNLVSYKKSHCQET